MTFEEYGKHYLCNNGMFIEQANAVIELAKTEGALSDTMGDAWRNEVDDYPQAMRISFIVALRAVAVKWIEEYMPKAWYLPVFKD